MATPIPNTVDGKAVFVGGASRTFDALISRTLADAGARVGVRCHSDSAAKHAQEVVDDIVASGGEAFSLQGDLTRPDRTERVFDEVVNRFGSPYASVNTVPARSNTSCRG